MSTQLHSSVSALVARDVVRSYGERVVLDGVDLVANPGRPLGLVGENGSGKSTLLRLVAGVERADSGSVAVPADLAYLAQEPSFPQDATIGDVLDEALAALHGAVARLEALATRLDEPDVQDEYAALLDWAVLHDAWEADHRAEAAAARLGLADVDRTRPVASLSGGQRMRLALAALVTRRPECVLLDEPTNHLDDGAVAFLEEFLVDLPGVVVVASHDRTFLDRVCAVVVDLDPMHLGLDGDGGNRFTGGYSAYLAAKRDARRRWEEAFLAQQEELDDLRQAARTTARTVAPNDRPPRDNDKFIYFGKGQKVARAVSRRVRNTERRIEVLERERVPKPPKPLAFRGRLTGTGRGGAVHVRDLVVPGRLHVPRLDLSEGGHLLVTGANGSGKSTLLKVLAGELSGAGHVQVAARRVGYLPQEVVYARPDRTAAEVFAAATRVGAVAGAAGSAVAGSPRSAPAGSPRSVAVGSPRSAVAGSPRSAVAGRGDPSRVLADLGLLHPRELGRPVGQLSVGQQRRLALAILVARQPDLLLLDEPTNHISLALADELEESLQRSAGTVVVASHDRWLRGRWAGPVLTL